jgi:hypothetical protein
MAASIVVLFTLGMFLVPAAMASLTPSEPSHACCRRAHHHGEECDHAFSQPDTDHQLAPASTCCQQCNLPALTSPPANPNRWQIIETPTPQHSFAHEFYPVVTPQQDSPTQSERAPPAVRAHRFGSIHSVLAFVRQHI